MIHLCSANKPGQSRLEFPVSFVVITCPLPVKKSPLAPYPTGNLGLRAGAVRVFTGRGGELAQGLDVRHVLLVTDAGIVAAGHAARAQQALRDAGLRVTTFDKAKENPTTKCVDDCVAVARAAAPTIPPMARTQTVLWCHGATGRLPSRLV